MSWAHTRNNKPRALCKRGHSMVFNAKIDSYTGRRYCGICKKFRQDYAYYKKVQEQMRRKPISFEEFYNDRQFVYNV